MEVCLSVSKDPHHLIQFRKEFSSKQNLFVMCVFKLKRVKYSLVILVHHLFLYFLPISCTCMCVRTLLSFIK